MLLSYIFVKILSNGLVHPGQNDFSPRYKHVFRKSDLLLIRIKNKIEI